MTDRLDFIPMDDIRNANERRGHFFFERSTMRFFDSRAAGCGYCGPGGTFFVTSERFRPSSGPPHRRAYTVREQRADGSIETVGEFQGYVCRSTADRAARRFACYGKPALAAQDDAQARA